MKRFLLLTVILLLTACSTARNAGTDDPAHYIREAENYTERGLFEEAIKSWEKVREGFYSPELNALADLNIAQNYFTAERYIEAAAAYEDFLKQYPLDKNVPSALYHLGLSYQREILSPDRDQTFTKNAIATFQTLLNRYPEFPEAQGVRQMIRENRERLAAHELYIGAFYLRTGHPGAAAVRLENLLSRHEDFPQRPEAYFQLGKAYLKSENRPRATEVFKTLIDRYPETEFAEDAREILLQLS